MNAPKIADGDLVLVTTAGMSEWKAKDILGQIRKWVDNRGLSDVVVHLTVTADPAEKTMLDIQVISVNDVFEDEVLNKRSQ